MTYLFVDTNVLLHYRRLEEIDWLNLSKSKEVVIVLCPVVIRELDHHKVSHPQNKFRKRAQEIITSLHSRLSGAASNVIRDGVRLEFLAEDPDLDFVAHKLRTELADDWLIASSLDWKQKHANSDIRIVSADLGISMKAKARGISMLAPLETDKLVEESDADEKKIKKLQEELAEIKNALPDLNLCFGDRKNITRTTICSPTSLDINYVQEEMIQLRAKHPLHSVPEEPKEPAKVIRSIGEIQKLIRKGGKIEQIWPREEIQRYNSNLEGFYKQHEGYLRAIHEYRNLVRLTVKFDVILKNIGGCPAEDVDIHLHFPDGFRLFDAEENEAPKPPEQPDPPAELGSFKFDRLTLDAMRNIGSFGLSPRLSGPPPNVSSPSIRRTNSYDVHCHVKRAKHGYEFPVGSFLAVFDSYESATSFQIDYSILAANVSKATRGHLSVVVEKQNSPT